MNLRQPGGNMLFLYLKNVKIDKIAAVSHGYFPVCLLKLFSLVWVLSLFLSAFSLPSLHILHCLFLVYNGGYFGWLFFNIYFLVMTGQCWIIWRLLFSLKIRVFLLFLANSKWSLLGFIWIDLSFGFFFSSLSQRWLHWLFWLLFCGLFCLLSMGISNTPAGTRRNGRFLAIWTHPRSWAHPLPCSGIAHSCSSRTRSLSSSSH